MVAYFCQIAVSFSYGNMVTCFIVESHSQTGSLIENEILKFEGEDQENIDNLKLTDYYSYKKNSYKTIMAVLLLRKLKLKKHN